MTHLKRRVALGLVASAALMPVAANAQLGRSLVGNYTVAGRNPDGSAYSGTVQIAQTGNAVQITWNVGGQTYGGTGTLDGRVMTVDWGSDSPVVYVVMPNGELHGTWAKGTALDKLTPR